VDCSHCGAHIEGDQTTCPACGSQLTGATASFAPVTGEDSASIVGGEPVEGPVLVVRKGPQPGERFFIDRPVLTLGRDPESDIFLNDMTVSRAHARLEMAGARVTVSDSGSLNGTYVNGVCVDEAPLHDGDVLQIGTFQMVFHGEGEDS
jgi:pSer/pThr/pTyr-binding forkhead associated (FHA) protein